jgi:hypothetical protein
MLALSVGYEELAGANDWRRAGAPQQSGYVIDIRAVT